MYNIKIMVFIMEFVMLSVWELIVKHVINRLIIVTHVFKAILSLVIIVFLVQILFFNVKLAQEHINTLQYVLYVMMDILYLIKYVYFVIIHIVRFVYWAHMSAHCVLLLMFFLMEIVSHVQVINVLNVF